MVQGYYSLEEAAQILAMSPDQLSQMAQRREVRAFADRGTWRFRTQDVEEMARRMGHGSNPDLQLGEAPPPKSGTTPKPGTPPKKPTSKLAHQASVFDFPLNPAGDQVEIGQEIIVDSPSSSQKGKRKSQLSPTPQPGSDSDVKLVMDASDAEFRLVSDSDVNIGLPPGGPKSGAKRKSGIGPAAPPASKSGSPLSPRPAPGSDSDVKLVPDASDAEFRLVADSNVRLDDAGAPAKPGSKRKSVVDPSQPASGTKKRTGMTPPRMDSGVRLVPFDDAGTPNAPNSLPAEPAPRRSSTESDIRLEGVLPEPKSFDPAGSSTMEIDLDEELRKAEEAAKAKKPHSKVKAKTKVPKEAARSPFELQEEKQPQPPTTEASAPEMLVPGSDFDLSPEAEKAVDSDFELEIPEDEEVALGELGSAGSSGINLHSPADSGIDLAKAPDPTGDQVEFELSLDAESTPRPSSDSSSDEEGAGSADSDFELTLDEGGELAAEEAAAPAPSSGEKDIFETDFEMPALDQESSSEAVALDDADTDLESSDFDLSLGEEESSSVAALEGVEELEAGETGEATPEVDLEEGAEEPEEVEDLLSEDLTGEEEEEETAVGAAPAVAAAPAHWGWLPATLMFPCVIVMFLLAFMSFELLHGMWGYKQSYQPTGFITRAVAGMLGIEPEDAPKGK